MKRASRVITTTAAAICGGLFVIASSQLSASAAPELPIPLIPCGDTAQLTSFINEFNHSTTPTHIYLTKNCVYTATASAASDALGADAFPVIAGNITITGQGATIRRSPVGSGTNFRLFHILAGGSLTLDHVTVTGGSSPVTPGGAILDLGHLTLTGADLSGNTAAEGGAVYIGPGAASAITGGALDGNEATNFGGAIANEGTLDMTGTVVQDNAALNAGGAVQNNSNGHSVLTSVSVVHNLAASGGGISDVGGGQVILSGGQVTGNVAARDAGGLLNASGTVHQTGVDIAGNIPTNCLGGPTPVPDCSS